MNPRCCRACNRPLIGEPASGADAAPPASGEPTCHACHTPSGTRLHAQCCKICGVDDPRMLGSRRLADGWSLLCANHAAVLGDRWIRLSDLEAECAPADAHAAVAS